MDTSAGQQVAVVVSAVCLPKCNVMSLYSHKSSSASASELIIDKCESTFDRWLQIQYLPSGFRINENDKTVHKRVPWTRKLKFDVRVFCKFSSIELILIWILSMFIVCTYMQSDCVSIIRHNHTRTTTVSPTAKTTGTRVTRNTTLHLDVLVNSTETSPLLNSTSLASNWTTNLQFSEKWYLNLVQKLLMRVMNTKENSNCVVLTSFVFTDFGISTLFLLTIFLYMFHIVELTVNFPWFLLEMICAAVYSLIVFSFAIVFCVISHDIVQVILAILQCVVAMFYILNRYYKWRSGIPAQDISDDVDGDYIRRMKNFFHNHSEDQYQKKKFISRTKQLHEDVFSKLKIKFHRAESNGVSVEKSKSGLQKLFSSTS